MADRDKLAAELAALAKKQRGIITPDAVVEAAKKPGTALNGYFEERNCWNLEKAAHQFQLSVARELIRSVKVELTYTDHVIKVPEYIRNPIAGSAQGYVTLARIQSSEDTSRDAVMRELERARSILMRARNVQIALGVWSDGLDELRDDIINIAKKMPNE